jgi:hypothetical protein
VGCGLRFWELWWLGGVLFRDVGGDSNLSMYEGQEEPCTGDVFRRLRRMDSLGILLLHSASDGLEIVDLSSKKIWAERLVGCGVCTITSTRYERQKSQEDGMHLFRIHYATGWLWNRLPAARLLHTLIHTVTYILACLLTRYIMIQQEKGKHSERTRGSCLVKRLKFQKFAACHARPLRGSLAHVVKLLTGSAWDFLSLTTSERRVESFPSLSAIEPTVQSGMHRSLHLVAMLYAASTSVAASV